jgi:two-component system OmpR family sensor kinase/two-component system sensor histidine kinase BaeS
MRPRLFGTLLLAFALVIVLGVCGTLGFFGLAVAGIWEPTPIRESIQSSQGAYARALADYYVAHGRSWEGVEQRLDSLPYGGSLSPVTLVVLDEQGREIASSERAGSTDERVYTRHDVVVEPAQPGVPPLPEPPEAPDAPHMPMRPFEAGARTRGVPIVVDNLQIGTLVARPPGASETVGRRSISAFGVVARSFLLTAVGLMLGLMLLAALVARRISRPLRSMTAAAQALASGRRDVTVQGAMIRELDDLASAFNGMAGALGQSERQRRQMTADIAHELRTPLTIIKGRLEGMQDGVYQATPEQITRLLGETALLERLIDDLRLLALAESGQLTLAPEQVCPADLIQDAADAFSLQAEEQSVALAVDVSEPLPAVLVDPQRLAQVLGNLVSNGLRYTPAGGTITLVARPYTPDEEGRTKDEGPTASSQRPGTNDPRPAAGDVWAKDEGRWGVHLPRLREGVSGSEPAACGAPSVLLQVRDSGQGIAPEDLPHVFDRFWRADRSRTRGSGGAGLGLAIARQIITLHGGTIWAESAAGQGTTISIALPASYAANGAVCNA